MRKTILFTFIAAIALISCEKNPLRSDSPNYSKMPQQLAFSTLKTLNAVEIRHGGFGSGASAHPTKKDEFYLLTDRGPNTEYKNGKKFLVPDYTPSIGHFKINSEGLIEMVELIKLKDPLGELLSGLPHSIGPSAIGEVAYDIDGNVLPTNNYGLDTEGLAAMPDGSFWVSDEYGPYIVHFAANGNEIERITPSSTNNNNLRLPAVFGNRRPNRGMEGLCVTPDGRTLVGIMQSTMYLPSEKEAINKTLTRIVCINLADGKTQQFLYKQEDGLDNNSDICAINDHQFLVIERNSKFGSRGGVKRIYQIDITDATDVTGDDYNASYGLLINKMPLETLTWDQLKSANIKPVTKTLFVDLVKATNYDHDKTESIIYLGDNKIAVFNDDDFAIQDINADGNPEQKTLPKTGTIDNCTMYVIDGLSAKQ